MFPENKSKCCKQWSVGTQLVKGRSYLKVKLTHLKRQVLLIKLVIASKFLLRTLSTLGRIALIYPTLEVMNEDHDTKPYFSRSSQLPTSY